MAAMTDDDDREVIEATDRTGRAGDEPPGSA